MGALMAWGAVLVALLVSLALVRGAIAYAHRRGMLDQPGQRRSHHVPTARGGGVGIIVAFLFTGPACLASFVEPWPLAVALGLGLGAVLVAGIGWWDDHHSLPVLPRFGVQLMACAIFSVLAMRVGVHSWLWLPALVLAGTWSINLHNFMDGIDGLLAQQTLFVSAGFVVLAYAIGQGALAVASACLVASTLGFWFFNRPRASIFMGDVGSGSLGFLLFAFTVLLWEVDWRCLWPALILNSCFVTDATLTLLNRFIKGRRWYAPHREHLYQWLVRSGMSHAQGGACYLAWNLAIAAPFAWLSWFCPAWGLTITVTVYIAAGAAWKLAKRQCLWRIRHKAIHVAT